MKRLSNFNSFVTASQICFIFKFKPAVDINDLDENPDDIKASQEAYKTNSVRLDFRMLRSGSSLMRLIVIIVFMISCVCGHINFDSNEYNSGRLRRSFLLT